MSVNRRALLRALLACTLVGSALQLSAAPGAHAVTRHRPLNDTRAVGSAPVHIDFPIEFFGLVATLKTSSSHLHAHGRAPYGEARFHVAGRWTHWRALDQGGAQQPGHFTAALVRVDHADAYQVRGLPAAGHSWRAAAINTTDGPSVVEGHARADNATASPTCMSRADWGADESISGWSRGDAQSYFPVQALTVHHTAGSNDLNQDYAATVRAIYSYHVQTNHWSDIGYQYLIDGHGVVYEGRNSGHTSKSCLHDGGDGSEFAHQTDTDDIVTGANVEKYNSGNVGIALMGCYEPTSSTCTGNTQPPSAATNALDNLVASLSARHHLDPDSRVHYVNPVTGATRDVMAVSGHRDWKSTACPGGTLYEQLEDVRSSTVTFAQPARTVAENAGTVNLKVTRRGNTALPATVDYAATPGNSTAGSDYSLSPGTLSFAAGETSKTIALNVLDDTAAEPRETLTLALNNPGVDTHLGDRASTTVTIKASDQQPDTLISTAAASGYVGNDIYNTSGQQQTKTVQARRTQTRSFYLRVYNDGNVKTTITIRGSAARSASTLRYYAGTTNITTAMRSAAGWQVKLSPAAYKVIKVQITIQRSAAIGSHKPATVTGTWTGDGTRSDLGKAVVNVTG